MGGLLLTAVGAALVNNVVLVRFLGLCPVLGTSRQLTTAAGMAAATTLVLAVTALLGALLDRYLLEPFGLGNLRIISYILVIASVVQASEQGLRRGLPLLHARLGVYLPLITTNCAVLGVALLNSAARHDPGEALAAGLGAGLGFGLVLILFAGLRERLAATAVPLPLRGAAIALVTAGVLSLAFTGFAGLDRG
jgi:Na+-translocating ferredoxin:NAD+ oxidoreductase subunit A